MTVADRVFDPGLQPERTLLAWRRTSLAFAAASVVAFRFTGPTLGFLALPLAIGGAGMGIAAYFTASARYRRGHESLIRTGSTGQDGLPLVLAAVSSGILAVACMAFLSMSLST
ncbi:DUF202 domain-containing protein [Nocardioides sp. NPDC051685]|uniref:DUF202 domain-containing protein n=1 Tax=Nocardioides sp. NPDC051685 TaxID=3364334 RepID=UPI00379471CB